MALPSLYLYLHIINMVLFFAGNKSQLGDPVVQPAPASMLLSYFSEIKCPLAEILTAENRDPIEKDCSALLSQMVTDIVDVNDKEMLVGLLSGKNKVHHVMELTSLTPLRLQKHDLVANLDRETRALYDRMISKNLDEIVEIALVTRGQAAASRCIPKKKLENTFISVELPI